MNHHHCIMILALSQYSKGTLLEHLQPVKFDQKQAYNIANTIQVVLSIECYKRS